MYRDFFIPILIGLISTLCSCSDYNLTKIVKVPEPGDEDYYPDIRVTPDQSNLGSLQVLLSESYEEQFIIHNTGWANLEISSIYLENDDGTFSLNDTSSREIQYNMTSTLELMFHPDSSGEKYEYIVIESNDPDQPVLKVPITGEGLAPQIEVDPIAYDYGSPYVGCLESQITSIKNIGTTNLEVSRVTYSGTTDLSFEIDISVYGEAPWIIYPGQQILGISDYEAYDEVYDIGYLTVESNDPLYPIVIASQEGDAIRGGTMVDSFLQEETEKADILFVIDNSGSMSSVQSTLATNASVFITTLYASGADFNIAIITTDDSRFVGPIMNNYTPNLITEFENQVAVGVSGSPTEKGLLMAYQATNPGGDAEPGGAFMRTDSVLSIIFVSDEDDRSTSSVSSHFVPHFLSLKSSPDKIRLHSVADDPYGSDTCGDEAYRYEEATSLTSGIFTSICTTDWATDLESIADGSLVSNLDFVLSEIPIEDSIEVVVNGTPVFTGWTYDSIQNAVVFTSTDAPVPGETVDITYGYYIECT